MVPEDVTDQGGQPSSEHEQRKLWFEYLAKLNDRDLQSTRASGFTPWALLAVAAAIVYNAVPQIPSFLSIAGAATTTLVILVLELDAVSLLGISVAALIFYCAPATQLRLLPEHNRRAKRMQIWILRTILAVLAAGHLAASALASGSAAVRWLLVTLGLFWLLNLVLGVRKDLKKSREARRHKLPLPAFSASTIAHDFRSLLVGAFVLPFGALALAALFVFMRLLQDAGRSWVVPVGAATDVLGLVVVLLALLLTAVGSVSRGTFLALERDVILESLPPSEIRTRFIREALGPSLGDWLETLNEGRRESLARIVALTDSLKSRAQEAEAIDPCFPLERSGRAQKLLEELDAGVKRYFEELKGFAFQVNQVTETSANAWETRILTRIAEQFVAEKDLSTGALKSMADLRKSLHALANPPK